MIQPQQMPGAQPALEETPENSVFDAYTPDPRTYCEAYDADGNPRDHWKPILSTFEHLSHDYLKQRQAFMNRMRQDHGAAYNPFGDVDGHVTPWELNMIPMPVPSAEWERLQAGLVQRARLLNLILADLYGPRNLLKERRIPPEMAFANPSFIRACHGLAPAGPGFVAFHGADIYRDAEGRWRVIGEFARNPAGLGYALENRIVISRAISHLYHRNPIQRLAPFFNTFRQSLAESAFTHRDDPNIVILTPGPSEPTYFEHAFLSRYLGFPLVESEDLTVRNARVFLKKLGGLDPVDVILRQIPDRNCDPLAVRSTAITGVAGLIQAMRERSVAVINPVGSGFADTPALQAILPDLCRHLLGEALILENHPVWWCGDPKSLAFVMDDPEGLVFRSAFDPGRPVTYGRLAANEKAALRADVESRPYAYTASSPVFPSSAPGWVEDGVVARYAVLRHFLCADGDGFTVMPGGLAKTSTDIDALGAGGLGSQGCKDIWVLSETPVKPFSLLRNIKPVADLNRDSDLPSRVADHFLWLGRYLERAEGILRRVRAVLRRLSGEFDWRDIPEIPFLLEILAAGGTLPAEMVAPDKVTDFSVLEAELMAAIAPDDGHDTVCAILRKVKQTARNVRDRLSLDAWGVIRRLDELFHRCSGEIDSMNEALERLNEMLFTLSAFSGLAQESATRGLGWRFMDMGRRIERGINQITLIRIGLPKSCTDTQNILEAMLEVSDSLMTYRARYRAALQLAPVLDLLLVDEANPRSLAFQLSELLNHIDHLPRTSDRRFATPEERLSLKMLSAVRLIELMPLECGFTEKENEMAEFLAGLEADLQRFAEHVTAHYLSRIPTTSHYSLAEAR